MGREHLQNPDVNRSHEPTPNPSGGGEPMSGTLAEFPSWEGPGVGRFMESPLSFFRMHWDHEPPLTRPPATLSPSDGEREGVMGRFMERPGVKGRSAFSTRTAFALIAILAAMCALAQIEMAAAKAAAT